MRFWSFTKSWCSSIQNSWAASCLITGSSWLKRRRGRLKRVGWSWIPDLSFFRRLVRTLSAAWVGFLNLTFRLKGAVGYEYPTYSFQTTYQITVGTIHQKQSFPRRQESSPRYCRNVLKLQQRQTCGFPPTREWRRVVTVGCQTQQNRQTVWNVGLCPNLRLLRPQTLTTITAVIELLNSS